MELTGYCIGLRKIVKIVDPEIITMKNGRKAVKGIAEENPKYKIFRILGVREAVELEAALAR